MSTNRDTTDADDDRVDYGTTMIQLAQRGDGTWEATQQGLDVVGTGPSAARATEDLAATIANDIEPSSRGE